MEKRRGGAGATHETEGGLNIHSEQRREKKKKRRCLSPPNYGGQNGEKKLICKGEKTVKPGGGQHPVGATEPQKNARELRSCRESNLPTEKMVGKTEL